MEELGLRMGRKAGSNGGDLITLYFPLFFKKKEKKNNPKTYLHIKSHTRQFLINLSIQERLLVARKRGLESLFHKCANWNHG